MEPSGDRSIHRLDDAGWPASRRRHIMGPSEGTAMHGPRGIGLEDLAGIQRDQFVHYLCLARATHDPDDWPGFRHALVDALTAAFGLDDEPEGRGAGRAAAVSLVDRTRPIHDPTEAWPDFMEALWARRHVIRPDLC